MLATAAQDNVVVEVDGGGMKPWLQKSSRSPTRTL
ncbi:hypothetical protein CGMCC3_g10798 [Colletotrichum fructicola]|nr:uncharacterized protein CGMCC3_g10798 [Colletotrichum fructicola]KAE9573028.1 hypothetical protein CGMCC3_g10798 [Colletotrichum fructicola]